MANAAKDLKTGQIGTVEKVATGADLAVAPPLGIIPESEIILTDAPRKASGPRTVAQAIQDRYTILVRKYLTPRMVAAIKTEQREGQELRVLRGTTADMMNYSYPLALWCRNLKINRVVRVVRAEESADGIASLKVYRPRTRKSAKRTPPELSAAERAELAKLG